MKNFFKNKITLIASLLIFIINFIFLFGYGVIGFGTESYGFALFFEVSKSFYNSYAGIFWLMHLILAFVSLIVFIISLIYKFKK